MLDIEDIKNFNMSIKTVSKEINNNYLHCLKINNFKTFIFNYGHLRPSMYSILNKNYKENYKHYFSQKIGTYNKKRTPKFYLDKNKIRKLTNF